MVTERWRIGNKTVWECIYDAATGEGIGLAWFPSRKHLTADELVSEQRRRARLMAAAPALLDALTLLLRATPTDLPNQAALAIAAEAIAAAKGDR